MSVLGKINAEAKQFGSNLYVVPNIPEKKLNNAVIGITKNSVDPDVVIAILDITLFNSCKNGFLFTGDSLYYKGLFDKSIVIKYENIKECRKDTKVTKKDDGSVKESYSLIIKSKSGENDLEISETFDYDAVVKLINEIISSEEDDSEQQFTNENQIVPLSDSSKIVKDSYIKLICNFCLDDNNVIDPIEYSEIYNLMVRNSFSAEERISIRAYMNDAETKTENSELIGFIKDEVSEATFSVITNSLIKDLLYINYKKSNVLNSWKTNDFIMSVMKLFNVSEKTVTLMQEAIQNDEDIIVKRKNDTEIQKSMKDLAAKGAAIGVPIAAVYFSGSVVGLSAAGITSGLAQLGMSGVLGFSPMVTGIGVAILVGVVTYNGVKKFTGAKDLENNKQRELMIQTAIKNLQKTINYLIEDVNSISGELFKAIESNDQNTLLIQKLKKILQSYMTAAKISGSSLIKNEKESVIVKLPEKLDKSRFEELTSEPTKQKLRPFIYEVYKEEQETSDSGTSKTVYRIDYNLEAEYYEKTYQILETLGYLKLGTAVAASVTGMAKKGLSALKDML